MKQASNSRLRTTALVGGALILLSVIAVEPSAKQADRLAATGSDADPDVVGDVGIDGDAETADGPGAVDPSSVAPGSANAASRTGAGVGEGQKAATTKDGKPLACKAGQNGGATDKGVTSGRIKLAATNVRSGIGSSFLGTAYIGMQAVVNRVNASGGVCGRLLQLRLVDDNWEAPRGATFIQNFINEGYFALPVVPSSEGLTQAIETNIISSAGIPVVGSDGMLKEQYGNPWVWPVATATVSTVRIMAKHAHDNGAKSFAMVYDQQYKFGKEGAAAFRAYVKELTGTEPHLVGIVPGKASYSGDAEAFNGKCGAGCDFVAFLLDPTTANTYISSHVDKDGRRQGFGKVLSGGAQPLFNERFARDCGRPCDGMLVWTGYNPPIGRLSSEKAVAAYVDDVKSVDPGVDVSNQFLEGAYLGMKVFVAALEKAGPNLTRAAVRDAMNSMKYESGLSSTLAWGPNQRFANQTAQAFKIVTASGSFAGFSEHGTGFVRDPRPGVIPQ